MTRLYMFFYEMVSRRDNFLKLLAEDGVHTLIINSYK